MTQAADSNARKITLGRVVKWGFILCIGVPLVAGMILRMSLTFQVKALEERVRERGELVSLAELEESLLTVSDDRNAAVAVLKIWAEEEGPFWDEWRKTGKIVGKRNERSYDQALLPVA